MRYVPYVDLASRPNVIVDGAAASGTVLALSHWPRSGTPAALAADTSTGIVFNYLDAPAWRVDADAVSNNHFDEDGLVGIFAMVDPDGAHARRDLLIDVATAGDFGVFRTREAARIAFTLAAHADAATSPLGPDVFALPYGAQTAALYHRLLEILPGILVDVNGYRRFWEADDAELTSTERRIDGGIITIEERRDLDLAVVRIPAGEESAHSYAVHTRTPCSRLLVVHGRQVEVRYRYEGWVQFRSRPVAPRVDLTPLAEALNAEERASGRWVFDGVDEITPRLYFDGAEGTSLAADAIAARLERHLRTAPPAWDPYA